MATILPFSYLNADGLPWDFGTDEAKMAVVAGYRTDGPDRCIELVIKDPTQFNATDDYVVSGDVCLPEGAIVTRVETRPDSVEFTSGGAATLSVGIIDDDFASNLDIDAVVVEASLAELNAGGSGNDGTGKVSPGDGLIVQHDELTKRQFLTVSVRTAVFTGGRGSFLIYYEIPKVETDTLVYAKS